MGLEACYFQPEPASSHHLQLLASAGRLIESAAWALSLASCCCYPVCPE